MRSDGSSAGDARALGTFGVLSVDSCMRSRSVVSRTDAADPANRLQGPTHRAIVSTPRHARRRRHRPTNNRPSLNHVVLYTSIAYRTTLLNHGCLHGQPPLDRTHQLSAVMRATSAAAVSLTDCPVTAIHPVWRRTAWHGCVTDLSGSSHTHTCTAHGL